MLDRLVDGTESRIRELIPRFVEENLLTSFQREAVVNSADTKLTTKVVFECVLRAIARDDSPFDRLIPILQDLGYGHLADELLRAALPASLASRPDQRNRAVPVSAPHEDSSHSHTRTEAVYHGPELDSGIATRNPTGRQEGIDDDVPDQVLDQLHISRSNSTSGYSIEAHSSSGEHSGVSMNHDQYSHTINDSSIHPLITNSNSSTLYQPRLELHKPQLHPRLELHEPLVELHNEEQHEPSTPVQAAGNNIPSDVIVLPNGERFMSETTASNATIEDGIIQSLTDRIQNLRQELQQKGAEGMQKDAENLELQENCLKLEEEVKLTSDKLKQQKQETRRVEEEKDAEIKDWKKKCKDKENEVKCLTTQIARIEKEKKKMTAQHEAQIDELNAMHRKAEEENKEKMAEYQSKITTLEKNLEETNQKKEKAEIDLAHAREQIANLKLEKEIELSKMKDERHALELKVKDLDSEILKKELLLQSKDRELAQEKHAQERRQSLALQQQVETLQKEIQRLRSQSSSSSNNSQMQDE